MNFFSIPAVSMAISIVICWALFAILCSLVHEAMAQDLGRTGQVYEVLPFEAIPGSVKRY
jgi:hypothetical protein